MWRWRCKGCKSDFEVESHTCVKFSVFISRLNHQSPRFCFHIFLCCIIFSRSLSNRLLSSFVILFSFVLMAVNVTVVVAAVAVDGARIRISLRIIFFFRLFIYPPPPPHLQQHISCYSSPDNLCDIRCFWCFHISLGLMIINWIVMSWFLHKIDFVQQWTKKITMRMHWAGKCAKRTNKRTV